MNTTKNENENDQDNPNKRIILYTIHCPRCEVLEKKLSSKNIKFETNEDLEVMKEKGFMNVPMLEVDGSIYDFSEAIKWVNSIGGNV